MEVLHPDDEKGRLVEGLAGHSAEWHKQLAARQEASQQRRNPGSGWFTGFFTESRKPAAGLVSQASNMKVLENLASGRQGTKDLRDQGALYAEITHKVKAVHGLCDEMTGMMKILKDLGADLEVGPDGCILGSGLTLEDLKALYPKRTAHLIRILTGDVDVKCQQFGLTSWPDAGVCEQHFKALLTLQYVDKLLKSLDQKGGK